MEAIKGKVLVTGINGFLASHIALQLLEKGYSVRGTVRNKSNTTKLLHLSKFPHQERIEIFEADLLKPETWEPAVASCDYVIHVASPLPAESPKYDSIIIKPAVEGTIAVLSACYKHKEVKGVVMTSSISAIISPFHPEKEIFTEEDFAEDEGNSAYNRSKILAEKAAWDLLAHIGKTRSFKFAVINPGFILGPALNGGNSTSAIKIKKFLTGEYRYIPFLSASIVDVRDAAAAHIAAMENEKSDKQRYICFSGETLWYEEIVENLRNEFSSFGYTIPTLVIKENFMQDPNNHLFLFWGKEFKLNNSKIKSELGITFKPAKEAILGMAYSLIEQGVVPNLIKK